MLLSPPFAFAFTFASLLALAACGGRSDLREAAGSGGAPATTSASTTTSVTSSGSGGACASLTLTGPPITTTASIEEHGFGPKLVSANEDGARAAVVFSRIPVEGPGLTPERVMSAVFAPWGAWPVSLGDPRQVSSWGFGADGFAVAPAIIVGKMGFSFLFYLPTNAFPSNMMLSPLVEPGVDYDPYPEGVSWDGWEPGWVSALARGATGHLAAYEMGLSGDVYLSLGVVPPGAVDVPVVNQVACANERFPVDVAPAADSGFLVAAASGRKFGACGLDNGVPGPATELQIMRVDSASLSLSLGAAIPGLDPIAHLAIAKRSKSQGAYVVWQEDGATAESPPPIRAALVDEGGSPMNQPFKVTQDGATGMPFAAAALGSRLAVAWVDALDPSTPNLRIDVFDEGGALITGASINTSPSWLWDASLSLLASPEGDELLLAWADQDPPDTATVRVARFSCF